MFNGKSRSDKIIIQVTDNYDYLISSKVTNDILTAIKYTWKSTHGKCLPIYQAPDSCSINDMLTSKKQIAKGMKKQLNEEFRLADDDVME